MKIYEVTLGADREWFSTKQGALSSIKELKATCPEMGKPEMQTLEVDPSKKGIVAILNKVAPTINPVAPEETKGAIRVTANKPPVPMSEEEIDQIEAWGLGELAKKCPETKKFLAAKEAGEEADNE